MKVKDVFIKFVLFVRFIFMSKDETAFVKDYNATTKIVDKLLIEEKRLDAQKERRKNEYLAIRDEANVIRAKLLNKPNYQKYDFLIFQLEGLKMRCTLRIRNMESKVRNAAPVVLNLPQSDIDRFEHTVKHHVRGYTIQE